MVLMQITLITIMPDETRPSNWPLATYVQTVVKKYML